MIPIDLLLGYNPVWIQTLCSVLTLPVVIFTLLYIALQVRILSIQTKHLNQSLYSQTYQAVYDRMIQIDQYFIANPDIKGCVYGDLPWPDNKREQQSVMSACEMLADLFQELIQLHGHTMIDYENWRGWQRYMRTIYSKSESFKRYFDAYGKWYTIDISSHLAIPAELACVDCKLVIDSPTVKQLREDITFWQIYEDAFPTDEKESPNIIYSTLSEKKGFVLRSRYKEAHYSGQHTVGLAIVHVLTDQRINFLVYLGVVRSAWQHGIGSQLLREAENHRTCFLSRLLKYSRKSLTVIEVDDPDLAIDDVERIKRKRRLSFFMKANYKVLLKGYWQPALTPDKKPVKMLLIVSNSTSLSAKDMVERIYIQKYGEVNGVQIEVLNELFEKTFGISLTDKTK